MFSKWLISGLTVGLIMAVLTTGLVGCNKFMRAPDTDPNNPQGADTIVVETGEVACLKTAPTELQKFLDDEGDNKSLETGISCFQESLKAFMKYTRGTKPDGYTTAELQRFFNHFLLKENKISDNFQHEIMKLKSIVVGGTAEIATRAELDQFINFLGEVKTMGQKLQGRMKMIFFRLPQEQVTYEQLNESQKILQDVAMQILDRSKVTSSRYQWVDLISFFTELNGFVGESQGLQSVLKWVPLAESVKLLFVGENAKLLTDQEWRASIRWAVDTYSVILKFYYEIRRHEFKTPREWKVLMGWLDEVLKGIETSPAMKEKKILDVKAIDRLAEEIYSLHLFQTELTLDLVKASYRKGLVHLLDGLPGGQGDPQYVDGLTEKHFRIFKHEYDVWKLSQTFLNDVYSKTQDVTISVLVNEAKKFSAKEQIKSLSKDPLELRDLEQSWIDYLQMISSDRPLLYNEQSKVVLLYNQGVVKNSFAGMNLQNFVRSITRLLIHGYGEKKSSNLFANRISEQGLVQLEEDFREFGQKIGFLDPRNESPAKRTFKEANFFTFHGNGDGFMTAQETYEELAILISGGRTMAAEIMADMERFGCTTGEMDIFGKPLVRESCFVENFRKNIGRYLNSMIWMKNFIAGLNDREFETFYQNVLVVSQLKPEFRHQGALEYVEIRTITTVLHYIESLMIVYDINRNTRLDENEIVAAVPRFSTFIESVSPIGDWFVEDIFLYLVYKGVKPTEVRDLTWFKLQRRTGLGEVGKLNLIKILGVLKKDAK